ncbi:MAG: aminoglycoside 6'-N-acetyltransferase [Armatimonadota bacterium]
MVIRRGTADDRDEWLRMRRALWPHASDEEHLAEIDDWLARNDCAIFVAERPEGGLCGFAEVAERSYADGCDTCPVAYLEGWYVDPSYRGEGVGGKLVAAAEEWARAFGYEELASDALLENTISQEAHLRLGFEEVDRVVQYRKRLTGGAS